MSCPSFDSPASCPACGSLARPGGVLRCSLQLQCRAVLSSRIGWLAAVTAIIVLSAAQLLYEFAGFNRYADTLHAAALATIVGEPVGRASGAALLLDVVLGLY